MKYNRYSRILIVLVFLANPGVGMAEFGADLDEVKNNLACTCACSMTVSACEGSMTCGEAAGLTREARNLLDRGISVEGVLEVFRGKYGNSILSAPPAEGFSLMAWLMPIFAFLVATLGISFILKRITRRPISITQLNANKFDFMPQELE